MNQRQLQDLALTQAVGFGVTLGFFAQLFLAVGMGIPPNVHDSIVLAVYLSSVTTVMFLILHGTVVIAGRLLKAKRETVVAYRLQLDIFALLGTSTALLAISWQRPFTLHDTPGVAALTVAFAVSATTTRWLWRKVPLAPGKPTIAICGGLIFIAAPLYTALAWRFAPPTTPAPTAHFAQQPRRKILVIGLDAATWDVILPLVKKGKLPCFSQLLASGSHGNLLSHVALNQPFANSASSGMRTPVLWETLATGCTPKQHGIWDFFSQRVPGLRTPFPFRIPVVGRILHSDRVVNTGGRCKRIWEILDAASIKTAVVGWPGTWPAARLRSGMIVSDRSHRLGLHAVYPESLVQEASKSEYFASLTEANRALKDFLQVAAGVNKPVSLGDESLNVDQLRKDVARDIFYQRVGLQVLMRTPPQLFSIYFESADSAQHLFWKYYEPQYFLQVREGDRARYAGVIPATYEFMDGLLQQVIDAAGSDWTVIIVSDHGAGPWPESQARWSLLRSYHPNYSGNHRKKGIILMTGPGIKSGFRLPDASVYDITPTLLRLAGLPPARDMKGRVLNDAFTGGALRSRMSPRVVSYGKRASLDTSDLPSSVDSETLQRLKALGYLK